VLLFEKADEPASEHIDASAGGLPPSHRMQKECFELQVKKDFLEKQQRTPLPTPRQSNLGWPGTGTGRCTPRLVSEGVCRCGGWRVVSRSTARPVVPSATMHGSVEWAMYFLFGMSGWWVYNTLSAEQPIFTACNTTLPTGLTADNSSANVNCTLPEGPALASQISVTSQLGNIVPLLYRGIVKYCCSAKEDVAAGGKRKLCTCARSLRVPVVILASMLTGLFAAILASFEWQTGTYVFGEEHSLVLLLCCFLSGGLGCMSSIIYWQFASMYVLPPLCSRILLPP